MLKLKADIVIVGAGLIGSSLAMNLSQKNKQKNKPLKILVVDPDLEGKYSSSELNAGGFRATWHNPLNAALSKLSIDYYEAHPDEVGLRQRGYFWLYSKKVWNQASASLKQNQVVNKLGVEFLSCDEIMKRHPFLDKMDGVGGATFSPKDGLLNPNLLKTHYRKTAFENGVEFRDQTWISGYEQTAGGTHVLCGLKFQRGLQDEKIKALLLDEKIPAFDPIQIGCEVLVNCTGAWSRRFSKLTGAANFSYPQRRQVVIFNCRQVDLAALGMFVDISGVYFHSEAGFILAGFAEPDAPCEYTLEFEGESFFHEKIWTPLYARSTKFSELKLVTGWAGLYEVSPDQCAVLGAVPGMAGVFEAHSFSGRGVMQSYGAGLALSELILDGKFSSIDLSAFSVTRFSSDDTSDKSKWVTEGLLI